MFLAFIIIAILVGVAATIPLVACSFLDLSKRHELEWSYDKKLKQWTVSFVPFGKHKKGHILYTRLWKRSQRSYATTVPHAVLLHIDENKRHVIGWEFSKELEKWIVEVKEVAR